MYGNASTLYTAIGATGRGDRRMHNRPADQQTREGGAEQSRARRGLAPSQIISTSATAPMVLPPTCTVPSRI